MATVTSSWWKAHEPSEWSNTGISARLRVYEENSQRLLEAGAGDRPKSPEQKRLGQEARVALEKILALLTKWKNQKPLRGNEAVEIGAFERQVGIARDGFRWYV